jgi:dephospho-CoA kinase
MFEWTPDTDETSIIVIIGRTNSGKSTLGKIIEKNTNVIHIEASTILRRLLDSKGMDFSPDNVKTYLRETNHTGVVDKISDIIKESNNDGAVITGLRCPSEIEQLYDEFSNVKVIHVAAPENIRKKRQSYEPNSDLESNLGGFSEKQSLDEELGISETISDYSDFTLENIDTVESLTKKASCVLEGL